MIVSGRCWTGRRSRSARRSRSRRLTMDATPSTRSKRKGSTDQDSIRGSSRRLSRHRGRGEEGRHRVRGSRSGCHPRLRGGRERQRTFEHLIGIFEASTPNEDSFITRKYGAGRDTAANKSLAAFLDQYDVAREANIIQLLAKNSVWQCPTLYWERGQWLVDVVDFTKDPDLAYTPRTWVDKKYPSMQKSILEPRHGPVRCPTQIRRSRARHRVEAARRGRAVPRGNGHAGRCRRDAWHQPPPRAAAIRRGGIHSAAGVADGDDQPCSLPWESVGVRKCRSWSCR